MAYIQAMKEDRTQELLVCEDRMSNCTIWLNGEEVYTTYFEDGQRFEYVDGESYEINIDNDMVKEYIYTLVDTYLNEFDNCLSKFEASFFDKLKQYEIEQGTKTDTWVADGVFTRYRPRVVVRVLTDDVYNVETDLLRHGFTVIDINKEVENE